MSLFFLPMPYLGTPPLSAQTVSSTTSAALATDDRRRVLLLTDLLIEEGNFEEAESVILKNAAGDAEPADWDLRLARLRNLQGRHSDAARLYRQILAARGEDPGLLLTLAQEWLAAGEPGEAREVLEKARLVSKDPRIPHLLSELAFSRGDSSDGRRLARSALELLGTPIDPPGRRLRLKLRSRLGWEETFDVEYGKLFDSQPKDPEILADWASVFLRAGLPESAAEPLNLLRERFPLQERSWRLLETDRLQKTGEAEALAAHLEESLSKLPNEKSLRLTAGEFYRKRRKWACAEESLLAARTAPALRKSADELLVEVREQAHHHAGPVFRWRESESSEALEVGAEYYGRLRPSMRLDAKVERGTYRRRSTGARHKLAGGRVAGGWERGAWTAGGDLDLRTGTGGTSPSPGLFARWEPNDRFRAKAAAWARRAWLDSTEGVAVGARADEGSVSLGGRPWPRIHLGGQVKLSRLTVDGGGDGAQWVAGPEAIATVLERPFYAALSWRFIGVGASGADSFFERLPLLRRSRIHYAVLSAGKRWLQGRLRADGYIYNGHEPELGRRFGTEALLGWGGNLQWLGERLGAVLGYETSQEHAEGIGGASKSLRAGLSWRWAPDILCQRGKP